MYDPFSAKGFQATSVTRAMNKLPTMYGRVGASGLFRPRGVATTTVMVLERGRTLVLLPTQPRGGTPNVTAREKRKARYFEIPHIPLEDHIDPQDIQNLLAFGSDNRMETMRDWLNQRLAELKMQHEQTHEYHRVGALQGVVYDADGTTVLVDWFSEFDDVTQEVVDFELDVDTTDVNEKCWGITRYYSHNSDGEMITGVGCYASESFMDSLINHPKVREAYANWQAAQDRLGGDMRDSFLFGGINFREYAPRTTAPDGTVIEYIPDGEAVFYPEGTNTTFDAVAAPGNFNDVVNTLGQVYYARIEQAKYGRGWDMWTESNLLHMCTRPHLLVKGIAF